MKKYCNGLAYIVIMASIIFSFSACSDDDDNFNKWDANYAYLVPQYLGMYTTNYTLNHSGEGITGPETKTTFTVKLKEVSDQDVIVNLELANSESLPQDKVMLSAESITIPAGKLTSDTVEIAIADWNFMKDSKDKVEYLTTVKLVSVESQNVYIGRQTEIGLKAIKNSYLNLMTVSSLEGTKVEDRSVWKIVIDSKAENSNNPGRLVDGSSTDIALDGEPFWITVDLGKETTITGIMINAWGSSYAPRGAELLTSANGTDWLSHGVIETSGSTQRIKFIDTVTCQHIKYNMTQVASSNRTSITEFNVYAK